MINRSPWLGGIAACALAISFGLSACGGSSHASGPQVGDCVQTNAATLAEETVPCASRSAESRITAIVDKQSQCVAGVDTVSNSSGKTFCLVDAHPPPVKVKVGQCVTFYHYAERFPCGPGENRVIAIVKSRSDCKPKTDFAQEDASGRVFCEHSIEG